MVKIIDVIIIAGLIFCAIFLIFRPSDNNEKKLLLIVEKEEMFIPFVDGKYSLEKNVHDIYGKNHPIYKHMEYIIDNGSINVISSDCANHICVNTAPIKNCGEAIICAPNRVAFIIQCDNQGQSK